MHPIRISALLGETKCGVGVQDQFGRWHRGKLSKPILPSMPLILTFRQFPVLFLQVNGSTAGEDNLPSHDP